MLPLQKHCTSPPHEEATFPCDGCPCHGRCHCHRRRHLRCHRCLRCHCRCRCCHRHCCNRPLSLPLLLAIAVVVSVNHCCRHLCRVAISHCCCRCHYRWPLTSLSPSAITVAIDIGHHRHHCHWPFPRVVALVWQELYLTN